MHSIIMTMLQLEIPGNIIAFVDAANDFLTKCTTVTCFSLCMGSNACMSGKLTC